jgi:hypothetical protein
VLEELRGLYGSPSIGLEIKGMMGWACSSERSNTYKIMVGTPLGRPKDVWEMNCEDKNWIEMTLGHVQW